MAQMTIETMDDLPIMKITEPSVRRQVTQKVLWAGARTMEKKMSNYLGQHHHVTGAMARGVTHGEIYEDLDGGTIYVEPDGYDARGISNRMKHRVIVAGYYGANTGRRQRKADPYIRKLERESQHTVAEMMKYQFELCLKELGLTINE